MKRLQSLPQLSEYTTLFFFFSYFVAYSNFLFLSIKTKADETEFRQLLCSVDGRLH